MTRPHAAILATVVLLACTGQQQHGAADTSAPAPTALGPSTLIGNWIVRYETGHYSSGNELHIIDSASTFAGYLRMSSYSGTWFDLKSLQADSGHVLLILRTATGNEERLEGEFRGPNRFAGTYVEHPRSGTGDITGHFTADRR